MDTKDVIEDLIYLSEQFGDMIEHRIKSDDTVCFCSAPKYYDFGRGIKVRYSPVFDFVDQIGEIEGCEMELLEEEETDNDKDIAILYIEVR